MKIEEAIKGIESLRAQLGSLEKFLHKLHKSEPQPKKVKKWVNLYRELGGKENELRGWFHNTKESANETAVCDRIACIEIEVDE